MLKRRERKLTKSVRSGRDLTKRDTSWHEEFLDLLTKVPNIGQAALQVGVARRTVYTHFENVKGFKAKVDEALQAGVDRLAGKMWLRALVGDVKPTTVAGQRVDVVEYPDHIGMFMLRAHAPDIYRERREVHHTGGISLAEAIAKANTVTDPDEGNDVP